MHSILTLIDPFVHTLILLLLQWKQLHVIILGQMETESINRMIAISGCFILECIVSGAYDI
jgi:hypothetical protein